MKQSFMGPERKGELMKTRIILFLSAAIFFAAQVVLSGQNYSRDFTKQSQPVYYEVWISGQRVARKFKTRKEAEDYVKASAREIRCAGETVSRRHLRKGDKCGATMAKEMSRGLSCYYLDCVKIKEVSVAKGVSVANGNINNGMPWQQNADATVSGSYRINQMEALEHFEPMPSMALTKMINDRIYPENATPEDKEKMITAWYNEALTKKTGQITSAKAEASLASSLAPVVNEETRRMEMVKTSSALLQPVINATMTDLGKTGLGIFLNNVQNPEARAKIFDTLARHCLDSGKINPDILMSSIDLMQQRMSNTSQTNKALSVQNQNRNQGLNVGNSDRQDEKARQAAMKAWAVYKDMCQKGFCKD